MSRYTTVHQSECVQKTCKYLSLLLRWLVCACSKLLQLHFCCSLLLLDGINDLENIWMWFAHDSLQPGVPAFDVMVCSWPIVIVVVPLLESELASIDPGSVEFLDMLLEQNWGGKASGCCLLHSFVDCWWPIG